MRFPWSRHAAGSGPPPPASPEPWPWSGWAAVVALALVWGLGPALPALVRGELLGQPWTDLYPSVWGLWWFAQSDVALPLVTDQLGHPSGMGFYYSSPLKGTAARVLLPVLGLPASFNLLTVGARMATVLCAAWAARGWGARPPGALAAAAVFGCAPFFHGYAVEGIIEGTDGWPLALWAGLVGRRRWGLSAIAVGCSIVASWYLGACALLLVLLAGLRWPRAWLGLGGLLLAAPFILAFGDAFPAGTPLDPEIRAAMGAQLRVPSPGALPGINPFAITTYVGWVTAGLSAVAVWRGERWLLWVLVPVVLSFGMGPWYALPGLEMLRFPYRWHAATLALLALAASVMVDRWSVGRPALAWMLGPIIAIEGLALSPIEPLIPGAPAAVPAVVQQIDGAVLDLPGPVALPPGVHNPSRPRSQWLLYFQTAHGQPSPWVPDFNSVGVAAALDPVLRPFLAFDQVAGGRGGAPLADGAVAALRASGVRWVVVHREDPGLLDAALLRQGLEQQGARLADDDGQRWLFHLQDAAPPPVDGGEPSR